MFAGTSPDRTQVILAVAVLSLALLAPLRLEGQDPVQPTQEPVDTLQVGGPEDTVQVRGPEDTVQAQGLQDTAQEPQDDVQQQRLEEAARVPRDTVLIGPPRPEIYVADLSVFNGLHYLGPLQKVTDGTNSYDNQPMFTPDSRSLLYTVEYGRGDPVQTEIHRYYFSSRRETRITRTDESEYSPRPVAGDRAFSAIRVEADSTRRVWQFTMEGMDGEVMFRNLTDVGHHAWGNESTVLLYVPGDPPTARIADLTTGQTDVVAQGIGRSLNKIPNRNAWSVVERLSPVQAWISEVDIATREVRRIIPTVAGGEFHTWTPEGVLLMAVDSRIYQWDPELDVEWRPVANLDDTVLAVTRIAVSPDGSKIAIVGDPIPEEQPLDEPDGLLADSLRGAAGVR